MCREARASLRLISMSKVMRTAEERHDRQTARMTNSSNKVRYSENKVPKNARPKMSAEL